MNKKVLIAACMCTLVFGQAFSMRSLGLVEDFLRYAEESYENIHDIVTAQMKGQPVILTGEGLPGEKADLDVFSVGDKVVVIRVPNGYKAMTLKREEVGLFFDHIMKGCAAVFENNTNMLGLVNQLLKGVKFPDQCQVSPDLKAAIESFYKDGRTNFSRNLYKIKYKKGSDSVGDIEYGAHGEHEIFSEIGTVNDPASNFHGFMYILYTRVGSKARDRLFEDEQTFLRRLVKAIRDKEKLYEVEFPKVKYEKIEKPKKTGLWDRFKKGLTDTFFGGYSEPEEE